MNSMFYRTVAEVPAGARIDHVMLSNGDVKVSFQNHAVTENGVTLFVNTDIELPLDVVYFMSKIADKLVEMKATLEEDDMPYLNATEVRNLEQEA